MELPNGFEPLSIGREPTVIDRYTTGAYLFNLIEGMHRDNKYVRYDLVIGSYRRYIQTQTKSS